jgi:hypothetical protein
MAKAADIEAIIEHVRAVVRERTGVDLEPEVQVIGDAHDAHRATIRQGRRADGRALVGARDLVPVRQRRARGAQAKGVDAHAFDPKERPLADLAANGSSASSSRCTAGSARTERCRARSRRWDSATRAAA